MFKNLIHYQHDDIKDLNSFITEVAILRYDLEYKVDDMSDKEEKKTRQRLRELVVVTEHLEARIIERAQYMEVTPYYREEKL